MKRKFILRFKFFLSVLFLSTIIFTSCNNLTDAASLELTDKNEVILESATAATSASTDENYVTLSGSLSTGGAYPEEIARTLSGEKVTEDSSSRSAFPAVSTTDNSLTYSITAKYGSQTCSGTISTDKKSYTVAIPVQSEAMTCTVEAKILSGDVTLFSGESESFTISSENQVVEVPAITLKALSSAGKGSIGLEINVEGSGISYCIVKLGDNMILEDNGNTKKFLVSSNKITVTKSDVDADAYSADFSFYSSNDELLYKFNDKGINVISGMKTNTWVQNGNEPWFVTTTDASGKKTTVCRITSAMVEGFKLTDIYVDSSRSTSSGTANYTTESGTFLNPCTMFYKANYKITDSTKDYSIHINGALADDYPGISGSIQAKTLTVYGSSESIYRLLQAAPLTIPVTYKNIIFENGCADESPGGGGINNQGTLTLDNCIIQNCDGDVFNGGGVFNNGTLNLLSGTITGNTAQNGAGVYIEDGAQMTMSGGTISGNESGGSSGAVHVGTNSLFTMTGGTISGNTAIEGGGLYIQSPGTFIMSGGTISGNTANSKGGALYVEGTFKISGSAYIPSGVNGVTGVGKNDVQIFANAIKIAGKLTPPAACTDGIVATITPSSYTAGTQLIELDTGVTDTSLPEAVAHFKITPDPANPDKNWVVDNEGKLKALIGTKIKPDAVGDIVFNDGSATPYTEGMTITDEQKAGAIALIYYKGSNLNKDDDTSTVRMLGIGLKHSRLQWCTTSAKAYNKIINGIRGRATGYSDTDFEGDKYGKDNLEQIISAGYDDITAEKYPALCFAKDYKSIEGCNVSGTDYEEGWFLPSLAELIQIYSCNANTTSGFSIDTASAALGGDNFQTTEYWSSTQSMSTNSTDMGCAKLTTKSYGTMIQTYYSYVCAIREF